MDGFAEECREALTRKGLSMRAAARALHYDVAYLSRVLNGKQKPSEELAASIDSLLGTDLKRLFAPKLREEPESTDYVSMMVGHFLKHDNRHGGDHVASAAKQVWKSEQSRIDGNTSKKRLAEIAEIAEVAGWLLFDANRAKEAREAFIESQMLAKLAGDDSMQWFAMDMLAMQDIQNGKPGEALAISEELMTRPNMPGRVVLLSLVRNARALALTGDKARTLKAIERAYGGLQDSINPRDPKWAWWVDEMEVIGHHGEVLISLGEHEAAIPHLHRANELVQLVNPTGRGDLYYSVAELTALANVGAWRETEATLTRIARILENVTSSRSKARLADTLRIIQRDAPAWLADYARDIAA